MNELVYYDLKRAAKMTPSLSVQVAKEIGRRVVAGSLEPGTLLEEENSLAERYQVSRVVIRDAVKILVGKGLLDVRRGIGTKVRPRSEWTLLDDDVLAWHITAPPNQHFISQLMDVRLAFEPKAARWAAERANPEALKEIEEAVVRMEQESGSLEKFIVADALFHQAVLRAAQNEFLTSMEGMIYSALLVSVRITNQDPRKNSDSVKFHRDLYEIIAKGDGDGAEVLTEKLLNDAIRRLKEAFGNDFREE
ncbi:FadR/GntR family transcriptional regulator [Alteromonas stellipolaris]|uniref:FadR/GntR family transcriptional regulator n=1 Tax=Alteromonas stellipolaris TaxID=233316 RepID=A0AAW7Z4H0_9ALTE|nr:MULTISPECIES: FadR/GntR family transcriptional regulator [Alteromonas]MBQ4828171.1 FadR family transcriptional regulator [Alteromonas sp. MMG017]MDO6535553.1 FadR/GntR family transcriptional regulator [Alteromonas stellipolaris]MDO6539748.1 FadR/GntR family transcriptional regulator [Alteromonas stellipolaris]MDO6579396.1 FadR/GntR family transcriptional regulator [Alteromonas stellipolaris]MDO6627429.1 FadR/GntR family transcriptional regulator [Alteromonas stellipolaris]|mmetsp:Transcript_19753/g.51439  ORF Transcript_19753/g.51439 Transcript_19753/m.51439 type:complete len:250 (+) Transcript_19753:144-893(+)